MYGTWEEAKLEQERLYKKTGKQWSITFRWETGLFFLECFEFGNLKTPQFPVLIAG